MDIKFVDIQTGNIFDGRPPYTFWFEGEQSTGLIYTQKICFVSKTEAVSIRLPENPVFKLVDVNRLSNAESGVDLENLITESPITSIGAPYNGFYVHMIYLIGSTSHPGEYTESLFIGGDEFLIGADFYAENESLYINLVNNGLELPSSIQKAIYPSNIREDKKDNILLNRKWKELLINLWDAVLNRGSYKSLFNSLKWFEYGDTLMIRELWRINDTHTQYTMQDIQEMLTDKYFDTLCHSKKTTYLSLGLAMQKIVRDENDRVIYDAEMNPMLENISYKWSSEDMALKMSILGNFYQTYFMPIHLDLMHSTIEHVVYSPTIKCLTGGKISRFDFWGDFESMQFTPKKKILPLDNVQAYVTSDTLFGSQFNRDFESEGELTIMGVQSTPIGMVNNDSLKTYAAQLYHAPGAIVEFDVKLPTFYNGEFVKSSKLIIVSRTGEPTVKKIEDTHSILTNSFTFSILCQSVGEYEVWVQFVTTSNRVFAKKTSFSVIDPSDIDLKVYRIVNNGSQVSSGRTNDYFFSIQDSFTPAWSTTYIPYNHSSNSRGIKLNHIIVLKPTPTGSQNLSEYITENYNVYNWDSVNCKVCISKQFGLEENYVAIVDGLTGYEIVSMRSSYVPWFHHMEELVCDPIDFNQYLVDDWDALCVVPSIGFGKHIEGAEWEFINVSDPLKKSIKIEGSVREPFIAKNTKAPLDPGYYNIIFRYKLDGEINEVVLDSAFIKK